jgi:NTP pyrophosphatase (non-canonical NTP hydrolase)
MGSNFWQERKGKEMSSFAELEMAVIRWSEDRGIIPNSTPKAQMVKLKEEVLELQAGIADERLYEVIDGVGDCTVVLLNICALYDISFVDCLAHAYDQIKDRTGHMGADGIFHKDK